MAVHTYRAFLVEEQDIDVVRLQGAVEVVWATLVEEMCAMDHVDAATFNGAILTWPPTLLRRLEWGDLPHYGVLGGISHWHFEAIMESLDSVMAQVVASSGRTVWTDMAWRRIARLHVPQRPCPDCEQFGPLNQMAMYGAILACDLCEGVTW